MPADLTRDAFLNGRLMAWQPRDGYRAATDPLLLAASVPARAGQSVLELGCGVGVALLALGLRVPGLTLTGVERQPDYADLARRNCAENAVPATIFTADLRDLPPELRAQRFDHVLMNPPYYPPGAPPARDPGRALALREETPMADWLDAALRRLVDGGWLNVIQRTDRVPQMLAALDGRAGDMALCPLAPRAGRPAGRVLLRARKGARGPFRLLAPLVLHAGAAHLRDGDDWTDTARAILRDGAALGWD